MNPSIGKTETGSPLEINIQRLLVTRMLVQADPGGGKSWALRRILEQTAGKVQQIILDIEGDFLTLREKFDYVICAPQGADAVATPQTAVILARRLRETRVSAIKDTAAELLNKLSGRVGLDIDVKRAAEDLGMTHKEATPVLRNLEPGEFFAYGPALSAEAIAQKTMNSQKGETAIGASGKDAQTRPPTGMVSAPIQQQRRAEAGNGAGLHVPEHLPRGQQKILDALAELETFGVAAPNRAQLGMVCSYNLTGVGGRYGQFRVDKKKMKAHRVAWLLSGRSIEAGKILCHTCDNMRCVNPQHLFQGTHGDNAQDRETKGRGAGNRFARIGLKGIKNPSAKIDETVVISIRRLRSKGLTFKEIAARHDLSASQTRNIANNRSWSHV